MSNDYLRAFIIGSSIFVIFPFYYIVSNFDPNKSNINYNTYIYYAPIGLGLANVLSLFLEKTFKLTKRQRFIAISLIAPTIVTILITTLQIYNYTTTEWFKHIINLYILYIFMFNIPIYLLDKYTS